MNSTLPLPYRAHTGFTLGVLPRTGVSVSAMGQADQPGKNGDGQYQNGTTKFDHVIFWP